MHIKFQSYHKRTISKTAVAKHFRFPLEIIPNQHYIILYLETRNENFVTWLINGKQFRFRIHVQSLRPTPYICLTNSKHKSQPNTLHKVTKVLRAVCFRRRVVVVVNYHQRIATLYCDDTLNCPRATYIRTHRYSARLNFQYTRNDNRITVAIYLVG